VRVGGRDFNIYRPQRILRGPHLTPLSYIIIIIIINPRTTEGGGYHPPLCFSNAITESQKSKMAASKSGNTYISTCKHDSNTIPTAIPTFSGARYPMVLLGILSGKTGSQKSKIAASNLEIRISRLEDMIATTFERLYLCFPSFPHVVGPWFTHICGAVS